MTVLKAKYESTTSTSVHNLIQELNNINKDTPQECLIEMNLIRTRLEELNVKYPLLQYLHFGASYLKEILPMYSQQVVMGQIKYPDFDSFYIDALNHARDFGKSSGSLTLSCTGKDRQQPGPTRFCKYCKRQGHLISECRTKKYKDTQKSQQTQESSSYAPSGDHAPSGDQAPSGDHLTLMACKDSPAGLVESDWIVDTGANFHVTPYRHLLHDFKPHHSIITTAGGPQKSAGTGTIKGHFKYHGRIIKLTLNDVQLLETSPKNLLSISNLPLGLNAVFDCHQCIISSQVDDEPRTLLVAKRSQGVYSATLILQPCNRNSSQAKDSTSFYAHSKATSFKASSSSDTDISSPVTLKPYKPSKQRKSKEYTADQARPKKHQARTLKSINFINVPIKDQPPGFKDKSRKVWKLNRGLYGLKTSLYDQGLLYNDFFLLIYANDGLIAGPEPDIDKLPSYLQNHITSKLSSLKTYLRIHSDPLGVTKIITNSKHWHSPPTHRNRTTGSDQLADSLTKPSPEAILLKFRKAFNVDS